MIKTLQTDYHAKMNLMHGFDDLVIYSVIFELMQFGRSVKIV